MEAGYQSAEFAEYCHSLSYRIETSPTRDKHAHGIAERSVGNIVTKANIDMLGNINNPCPQQFWPDAIEYACHSDGFGFKNKIGQIKPNQQARWIAASLLSTLSRAMALDR